MKIVLDTNVLLSAIFTHGLCEALLDAIVFGDNVARLVSSEYILDEFRVNAIKKFKAPPEKVKLAIDFLRHYAELVEPAVLAKVPCSDQNDAAVLGTAVGASAKALCTEDAELLQLGDFQGIPIIAPRTCYDALIQ